MRPRYVEMGNETLMLLGPDLTVLSLSGSFWLAHELDRRRGTSLAVLQGSLLYGLFPGNWSTRSAVNTFGCIFVLSRLLLDGSFLYGRKPCPANR